MEQETVSSPPTADIFSLILSSNWSLSIEISPLPLIFLIALAAILFFIARYVFWRRLSDFEIDAAEFGFSDQKISLKPKTMDRQIAYSIWVELSTRKVGLPIDPDHDVIEEVYNSWYTFFGVTREMIKDIPVSKVRSSSTSQIINLSIEVLNEGLRPHLTKWQARYRHWYEQKMEQKTDAEPQQVQKEFPAYDDLINDMLVVNQKLMKYREKMNELVRHQ